VRSASCALTVLVCLVATGAIAYLLGHSRALGHEAWRFEPRLARAYSNEVPFHAGPLWVLALACVLRPIRLVLATTLTCAGVAVCETHEVVKSYIVTTPGQFVSSPVACDIVVVAMWAVAVGVLGAVVYRRGNARGARQP
jgi:hypothetical protein